MKGPILLFLCLFLVCSVTSTTQTNFDDIDDDVPGVSGPKKFNAINTLGIAQYDKNTPLPQMKKHVSRKQEEINITYHGGPVSRNEINIYPIFYGAWNTDYNSPGEWITDYDMDNDVGLMLYFMNGIADSLWWGITSEYYQRINHATTYVAVSPNVITTPTPTYWPGANAGNNLNDAKIKRILQNSLRNPGMGNAGPNDIYVIILDPYTGVNDNTTSRSGLCYDYCSYHSYMPLGNFQKAKYAVIGNPYFCMDELGLPFDTCSRLNPFISNQPNELPMGDIMVNFIAHEVTEIATDPYGTSWYDANGMENADKCNWNFQAQGLSCDEVEDEDCGFQVYTEYFCPDDCLPFYIQRNWEPTYQDCMNGVEWCYFLEDGC